MPSKEHASGVCSAAVRAPTRLPKRAYAGAVKVIAALVATLALALALAGCGKAHVPDGSYQAIATTTSLPTASSATTVPAGTTTSTTSADTVHRISGSKACVVLQQRYHDAVLALNQSTAPIGSPADNALENNLAAIQLAMQRINCPIPQNGPITG